CMQAIEYPNSF
nr:immunoglobulin light chain junction region [Macaca mulatta]MOV34154.1 immunoglobulin light chain junction region [Macaca mulatta]MOV34166.1 immunoglobulin light chain junction region [Macaca mulatta]MOV34356.1 immunoglobulin light chain junction region [Macaca mulatta]MOV34622.1 immunoglobulin light chain junction region [Macaca mulatta]